VLAGCQLTTHQKSLGQINQNYDRLNDIWDGYELSERYLGYLDSRGALHLVSENAPDSGFSQLENGVWLSDARYEDLTGWIYVNRQFSPLVTASVTRALDPPHQMLTFLVHEDFHGYQRTDFENESVSTLSALDIGDFELARLIALLRIERALLDQALGAPTNELKFQLLTAYMSVRHWRMARLPTEFVRQEKAIETTEGTAEWVGREAAEILGIPVVGVPSISHGLKMNFEEADENFAARLVNKRVYHTGAALAELADQLDIPDWQNRIKAGENVLDIFSDQVAMSPAEMERVAEEFFTSKEFQDLYEAAKSIEFDDSSAAEANEWVSRYRWQVTLTFPSADSAGNPQKLTTTSMSRVEIPITRGIFLPMVMQLNFESENYQGELRGATLILPSKQDGPRQIVIYTNRVERSGANLPVGNYEFPLEEIEIPRMNVSNGGVVNVQVEEVVLFE